MSHPDVTVASTVDKLISERLDGLMHSPADTRGALPVAAIAELARLIGAVGTLRQIHVSDDRGRCRACRLAVLAGRRKPCTVHETLDHYLGPRAGFPPIGPDGACGRTVDRP
jgi:hypothetical protein